jgi:hypothetical protein
VATVTKIQLSTSGNTDVRIHGLVSGSPELTWWQTTTQRANIQYNDTSDEFRINAALGTSRITLRTADIEHIRIQGENEAAHGSVGILSAGMYWEPVEKGATNVIDWEEGNVYEWDMTASRTISVDGTKTPPDGYVLSMFFNYVSGSGTLTFPGAWRWNGGTVPSAPTSGQTIWVTAIWQKAGTVIGDWGKYS